MTKSLEKLNHLTVYHVNVEGDLAKAAFLKKLANGNLTNNKSRIAPPSAIITTETWVTDQHKIALLGKKWFSHFSQHPSSSDHKVRGQGGICIRVKKQPYWDIHPRPHFCLNNNQRRRSLGLGWSIPTFHSQVNPLKKSKTDSRTALTS